LKKIKDDRLVFTGYVKDQNILAELYHNCYVYVHGHEFGGTNPTMIKAMAYGCAILALDTVFNKEMLQKGKFGLFFKKELLSVTNSD
jgi:glycosyltransferase involved in cell wall biosynthesis